MTMRIEPTKVTAKKHHDEVAPGYANDPNTVELSEYGLI